MTKSDWDESFSLLGKCVVAIGLGVVAWWVNAFVLIRLWAWFMVPLFHLPLLTIGQALGLAIMKYWFLSPVINSNAHTKDDADKSKFWTRPMVTIGGSLVFWGVGAIIHTWVK